MAIISGIVKIKNGGKKLIILGCLGLAVTRTVMTLSVKMYKKFFHEALTERGDVYDKLRTELADKALIDLVKAIEYYKIIKGKYPETLSELEESLGKDSSLIIIDPTSMFISDAASKQGVINFNVKEAVPFFYQLTKDKAHYYLLSVGMDKKSFTQDDMVPALPEQERIRTGLLIKDSKTSM